MVGVAHADFFAQVVAVPSAGIVLNQDSRVVLPNYNQVPPIGAQKVELAGGHVFTMASYCAIFKRKAGRITITDWRIKQIDKNANDCTHRYISSQDN